MAMTSAGSLFETDRVRFRLGKRFFQQLTIVRIAVRVLSRKVTAVLALPEGLPILRSEPRREQRFQPGIQRTSGSTTQIIEHGNRGGERVVT